MLEVDYLDGDLKRLFRKRFAFVHKPFENAFKTAYSGLEWAYTVTRHALCYLALPHKPSSAEVKNGRAIHPQLHMYSWNSAQ
jgi:hypothetical protein